MGTNPKDWEKASVSNYMDGNYDNFISIMAEKTKPGGKNRIKVH